jgi:alanine dehydrogenase
MHTLLLDSDDVDDNTPFPELIVAVEEAFAAYERGDAQMPPKSYIDLPQYNGDFRSMPAYLNVRGDDLAAGQRESAESRAVGEWDAAGIKWVNVHTDNTENHDLPTVLGTMIYSDPRTAYPLAILDGRSLTMKRTGAAAAVATDHLAVADARSLGLVGAGVQAYTQLEAIATVRDIDSVVISDLDEERVRRFVDHFGDRFDVRGGSVEEAAACDVLSTVTPVESPIVSAAGDHTHVNAMGADAAGKHELADDLLLDARIVIDDYEQCTHSGEINVPYRDGVLTDADIDAELGEIVVGDVDGRRDGDGVTVFDSTGLAIQDVAAAHVAYEHATENDNGTAFDFFDL